ncbi:protein serac1 [Echinococcus multilocularis]|uniref:Protein serac1 n=1 Tax=Echinococcus multilocularis TaxID=6211 RepID=A0A068YKI8_ECHMU|nr:protein serac1 [Echinococcus multilocularis]
MHFTTTVARVISLSAVWGTLLVAHFRRRRQNEDGQNVALPLEGHASDPLVLVPCEDATGAAVSEAWGQDTALTSRERSIMASSTTSDDGTSLVRRVLSAIGSFMSPSPAEEQAAVALVDQSFTDSMNIIKGIASSLDLPTHLPESFYARLPFRRSSSNDNLKALMEQLELLTFYSKSNGFLNAVAPEEVSSELVQHTIGKLENMAIYLLAAYFPADGLEASAASDLNLLRCLEVPAAHDLTPFPCSRPKDHLIRFGYCQFQFASFLANLSLLPEAVATLSQPCLKSWLEMWSTSQDVRLQLLSTKIQHNLLAHKYLSSEHSDGVQGEEGNFGNSPDGKRSRFYLPSSTFHDVSTPSQNENLDPPVIYGPDVFKLDKRDDGPGSPPPKIDIIFVNGMLGSVFHTWRQRDSCNAESEESLTESGDDSSSDIDKLSPSFPGQIRCWPQAWLSEEFPEARILGINANLRPFVWNPICPAEKTKRRIDQRARDILQQLLLAGVGRRPIVWVAHSAGGILTKEVLKLSATWIPESSATVLSHYEESSDSLLHATDFAVSVAQNLHANEYVDPASSDTALLDCGFGGRVNVATIAMDSAVDMEVPTAVAHQTKGIIFLSVPHRGNQSMMFLYYFPMVFTLTPEAKQLQQNNASIISLHNWFLEWVSNCPLQVLNLVEDRETVINRWYSVHLVQPEPQDTEFSEVVLVDTNHTDICKPRNQQDEVYVRVTSFIRRLMESS